MASPPPYIPAPALYRGSFLTASQLILDFQDFYANLEYISCAPIFVFERLVGSLNQVFTAALERERLQHATALEEYRDQNKILQLSNNELKKEGAKLKESRNTSNPDTQLQIRSNPVIGTFCTWEVRPSEQPRPQTSRAVSFARPYSEPPGLVVGLNMLGITNGGNIRVKSYASNIERRSFDINIDSWSDTMLCRAGCSWLEVAPNDSDFQFGVFSTKSDHPINMRQKPTTRLITFTRPYQTPPKVVVWLSELDMHRHKNWRVKSYANYVTTTGFTMHIDTWDDTILFYAAASWVAYPADRPNVFSGEFSTSDMRPHDKPQLYNSAYEHFDSNIFTAPPKTFLAINSLDIDCNANMRLDVTASSVSAAGMTWHIDSWDDTILYYAGVSYIALG